jgi:DNA-binding PadR family transcriptional regulator
MRPPLDLLPLKPADFHVLLVLMDGSLHGYGIMKAVDRESRGEVRLEIGSLYRLLGRLLSEGLLKMGEEEEGRRRDYSLTPLGRKVLKAEARRLSHLMSLVRARKLLPEADA